MLLNQEARLETFTVPAHVPPERVVPLDLLRISRPEQDPFEAMDSLRDRGPIFYTPVHFSGGGGAWALTRAEDIRAVLTNPSLFSSRGQSGIAGLLGESWQMTPLELDPPRHTQFRTILNPLFAPKRINAMEAAMRASCVEMIEAVRETGGCELMTSFARPFPVRIFLQLMGLPLSLYDDFLAWNNVLLFSPDMQARIAAASSIRDYLRGLIDERRGRPGGDDFIAHIMNADVEGQPLTDDDLLGIFYLLFVGGLDTVAASLGFYFKYLAEHPQDQERLRADPSMIPAAVEELLRAHSVVMCSRRATADTELAGQPIKAGDWVVIYTSFASLDPKDAACPRAVDFDRPSNRHIAFSYGPHRCVGSHLARLELKVALEEWTQRVPSWRIAPGATPTMHGGVVFSLDELQLAWA